MKVGLQKKLCINCASHRRTTNRTPQHQLSSSHVLPLPQIQFSDPNLFRLPSLVAIPSHHEILVSHVISTVHSLLFDVNRCLIDQVHDKWHQSCQFVGVLARRWCGRLVVAVGESGGQIWARTMPMGRVL